MLNAIITECCHRVKAFTPFKKFHCWQVQLLLQVHGLMVTPWMKSLSHVRDSWLPAAEMAKENKRGVNSRERIMKESCIVPVSFQLVIPKKLDYPLVWADLLEGTAHTSGMEHSWWVCALYSALQKESKTFWNKTRLFFSQITVLLRSKLLIENKLNVPF